MPPTAFAQSSDMRGAKEPLLSCGGREEGVSILISLIALSVFSLIGLYMTFNATTELRISDNYESSVQAGLAAQAGLNHAREALRGLPFGNHLSGPDGIPSTGPTYAALAMTYAFRNPLPWNLARSLNIVDPTGDLAGFSDDGIMNTGIDGAANGTPLIPLTGVVWSQANPNGAGNVIIGRYFVKVTNNVLEDPSGDPFVDGDNIIIARSMGVAGTIREDSGGVVRRNTVVVYEARFIRRTTFDLDAPFVVEGSSVLPSAPNMFSGNAFSIDGGATNLGIATIDTDAADGIAPTQQISSQLVSTQYNNVTGMGGSPSIGDITALVSADPDKSLLKDPNYLWNFMRNVLPPYADSRFYGNQRWSGLNAPDLGSLDVTVPYNDPSQRPRITYVEGDLDIAGNISGGGILAVTGRLYGSGRLSFNGLILVIGTGDVDGAGLNIGFNGGMLVAHVYQVGGTYSFDTPKFSWKGNSNIKMNSEALKMAVELLPLEQRSWREITGVIDP